jgi:hypothetical protein
MTERNIFLYVYNMEHFNLLDLDTGNVVLNIIGEYAIQENRDRMEKICRKYVI